MFMYCLWLYIFLKYRTLFLSFWLVSWLFITTAPFFYSPSPLSDRMFHILNLSGCFIVIRVSIGNIVYFLISIF